MYMCVYIFMGGWVDEQGSVCMYVCIFIRVMFWIELNKVRSTADSGIRQ